MAFYKGLHPLTAEEISSQISDVMRTIVIVFRINVAILVIPRPQLLRLAPLLLMLMMTVMVSAGIFPAGRFPNSPYLCGFMTRLKTLQAASTAAVTSARL